MDKVSKLLRLLRGMLEIPKNALSEISIIKEQSPFTHDKLINLLRLPKFVFEIPQKRTERTLNWQGTESFYSGQIV